MNTIRLMWEVFINMKLIIGNREQGIGNWSLVPNLILVGYFKTVDRIRESGTGNQFLVPCLGIYFQCFKSAYRE